MYTVTFRGFTLYDPRLDDYIIRDPDVRLAVGEPGSVAFTIDDDHPNSGALTKLSGTLELRQDESIIYRGRIIRDEKNFYNSRRVETEGLLAALNDSVIPPFSFPEDVLSDEGYVTASQTGNVVAFMLGWFLNQHNAQVDDDRKILLGTVTVTDQNNYISRSSGSYDSTWGTIKKKLPAGHLIARYEEGGTYLDFLDDFPLTNVQRVTFGENLLDLLSEVNAADVYTAILPLGRDGLTVADLPDGQVTPDITKEGNLLYSSAGREAYGKITKVVEWSDVTQASRLQAKAASLLAGEGVMLGQTITVRACDLHTEPMPNAAKSIAGVAVAGVAPAGCEDFPTPPPSFHVGRHVILSSEPHGISRAFTLTELEPDILDPGNTRITLGSAELTQTDRNQAAQRATEAAQDAQRLELDKQAEEITEARQTATEAITTAIQTAQSIVFTALENYVETGDLDTFKRQVETQFEQTAGEIQMRFKTVTDKIENVNGDLQSKYNEQLKYIRFVNGDIVLGEEGNEITLTIENDRMAFKQNGREVAWFSNQQFHVTEAEFSVAARIGAFAFVPGAGGNLSFKKVVAD